METVGDIVALLGTASIAGLWGFCMLGGIAALWETFGDGITEILDKLRSR